MKDKKETAPEVLVQKQDKDFNFCSKTGVKLHETCPQCWIKNKPYNCGFEKCPGRKLYLEEVVSMEDKKETISIEELELNRQEYLQKFKKRVHPKNDEFDLVKTNELAEEIINLLKEKELTYVDAYATLEYVYRALKFMSEYTHL